MPEAIRSGARSPTIAALTLGVAIDYFRWTQLVPMIAAWTFLLIGAGALLLVNFQEQSFTLIERGVGLYEQVFGPIEPAGGNNAMAGQAGGKTVGPPAGGGEAVRFSDQDIMPEVLSAWAWVALAGYLLGLAHTWLFGPSEPWSLGRKLVLAAIAAAGVSALMFGAYWFGSEPFHGGFSIWFFLFTGAPLLVWLVSLYSLGVGYLLERLKRAISGADEATGGVDNTDRPT